jgi:hypothetical protein
MTAAAFAAAAALLGGLFPQDVFASLGLPSWFNINFISLMTAWGASEVRGWVCFSVCCSFYVLVPSIGQFD